MSLRAILGIVSVLAASASVLGQGSRRDYDRVHSFRQLTEGKVFRTNVRPNWMDGRPSFWYRVQTGIDRFRFVLVDAEQGQRGDAFDHERLAEALAQVTKERVDPNHLPFRRIRFSGDASAVRFSAFGKGWRCELENYEVSADLAEAGDATTVRVLDRPRRSRGGGEETHVRFINRTASTITLHWIDTSGGRKQYGRIAAGKEHHQHTYARHVWLVTDAEDRLLAVFEAVDEPGDAIVDGKARVLRQEDAPTSERRDGLSPDGQWQAFIKNHNLHVRRLTSDDEAVLTEDGTEDDPYRGPLRWSPDSAKLIAFQERRGEEREVHLIESSPSDQLHSKLHTFRYAKPGDQLPRRRPRLFHVETRKRVPISDDLFPNPWSVSEVRWQPNSKRFTFLYNQRGHQVLRIVVVDASTGEAASLINETSKTFVDYSGKRFTHYLDETHEIVWMSERDGWNHLYLYDSRTGQVKNQITSGEWVLREVDRVDEANRQIWFRAGGIYPEQDPYHVHYCRVNFDGSDLVVLTAGNGTHSIDLSPDGKYVIDTYSRVDLPPVTELRKADDGSLVCELERGDWSLLLAAGWRPPERFVAKGRDGATGHLRSTLLADQLRSGQGVPGDREDLRRAPRIIRAQAIFGLSPGTCDYRVGLCRCANRWYGNVQPLEGLSRCLLAEPGRLRFSGSHSVDQGSGPAVPQPWTCRGLGSTVVRRAARVRCGRCWRTAISTRWRLLIVAATTTVSTRCGGTSSGWAGQLDPHYAEQSNVTNAHKHPGQTAADGRRT